MKSEGGGPWGGRDDDNSGSASDGHRQPWGQPRRRKPDRPPIGPPAIEALLRKGRERFGGRLPEPAGRPLWAWAVTIVVLLWLLLTCVHRIGVDERGVVTRLGRYAGTLDTGVSLTFPAPIDSVLRLPIVDTSSIELGTGSQAGAKPMLTADHNLVDLTYTVEWKISDPELYAYGLDAPKETIGQIAEGAMRGEVANASFDRVIGPENYEIAERARAKMQQLLDRDRLGIAVVRVIVTQAEPPKEAAVAFKQVADAQRERQQRINAARTDVQAAVDRAQRDAADFNAAYAQYRVAPKVTRDRLYYDMMDKILANNPKVIGASGVTLPLAQAKRKAATQGQEQPPIDVEAKR